MRPGPDLSRVLRWLVPGRLAGGPDPSLAGGMEQLAEPLRKAGVSAVVTLLPERLSPSPEEHGFLEFFAPTPDLGPPRQLHEIVRFIEDCLRAEEGVLVHCLAGIGRTGTVLAAWLLHRDHSLSVEDALARLREGYFKGRDQVQFPEDPSQESALRLFALQRRPD